MLGEGVCAGHQVCRAQGSAGQERQEPGWRGRGAGKIRKGLFVKPRSLSFVLCEAETQQRLMNKVR